MTAMTLTTEQKIQALRACPVFADIPGEEVGVLAEMMITESLAAGETLFEVSEPSDRVFVVATGRLDIFVAGRPSPRPSPQGEGVLVRSLGPGDLLGEYGMFQSNARTATVRAGQQTPAVLMSLDYQRFRAFLVQFPQATLVLLSTAVGRLVELERGGG